MGEERTSKGGPKHLSCINVIVSDWLSGASWLVDS